MYHGAITIPNPTKIKKGHEKEPNNSNDHG
jgi:hypothetical protein